MQGLVQAGQEAASRYAAASAETISSSLKNPNPSNPTAPLAGQVEGGTQGPVVRVGRQTAKQLHPGAVRGLGGGGCAGGAAVELEGVGAEVGMLAVHPAATELEMTQRGLRQLPGSMRFLDGLVALTLANNALEALPEWLRGLSLLRDLSLHCNCLAHVPAVLQSMTGLVSLDLSDNSIADLPGWLDDLVSLKTFDLSRNHLPDSALQRPLPPNLTNLRLQVYPTPATPHLPNPAP